MTTNDFPAHTNVDPAELAKFSDLAHRWWDPESEFKPLHQINPLRVEWINARTPLAGMKVLDVGCGGGILAEAMAALGADVTGIDLADKSLNVARLHLLESGQKVTYRKVPVEALAEESPAQFDIVTCLEMLEHVPDPASIIQACSTLVKPEGHVYFSTLNRNPKAYLFAIIGAEYVLKLLPKGTHQFDHFIKPAELLRWACESGLDSCEMTGLQYNPFTQIYSLGRDCSVNYLVQTRKSR